MKKLLLRIQHERRLRRLIRKFNYAIGKMRDYEYDIDSTEWLLWAQSVLVYSAEIDNEVIKYAQILRD